MWQSTDDEMADLDAAVFMQKAGSVDVKRTRDVERQALLTKQEKESPWCVTQILLSIPPLYRLQGNPS